jgi:hypothetical protein
MNTHGGVFAAGGFTWPCFLMFSMMRWSAASSPVPLTIETLVIAPSFAKHSFTTPVPSPPDEYPIRLGGFPVNPKSDGTAVATCATARQSGSVIKLSARNKSGICLVGLEHRYEITRDSKFLLDDGPVLVASCEPEMRRPRLSCEILCRLAYPKPREAAASVPTPARALRETACIHEAPSAPSRQASSVHAGFS